MKTLNQGVDTVANTHSQSIDALWAPNFDVRAPDRQPQTERYREVLQDAG